MAKWPTRQPRHVVDAIDLGDGEALHHAVIDHRLAAGAASSAGWKMTTASPEKSRVAARCLRGAEQHGGVPVMAAGMHLAGHGRGVGQAGRLGDRQGVHVGPQADSARAGRPLMTPTTPVRPMPSPPRRSRSSAVSRRRIPRCASRRTAIPAGVCISCRQPAISGWVSEAVLRGASACMSRAVEEQQVEPIAWFLAMHVPGIGLRELVEEIRNGAWRAKLAKADRFGARDVLPTTVENPMNKLAICTLTLASMLSTTATFAAGMLTNTKGMTLYTFDKDKGKISSCYGECAKRWPPYAVQKGEKMGKDWAKTKRKDGSMQWTYDGHPLYTWTTRKPAMPQVTARAAWWLKELSRLTR